MTNGPLQHFACPVCGRLRPLGDVAQKERRLGTTTGECANGTGCRAAISQEERFRRFWLVHAGISRRQIRAAGGAGPYVLEFGLPEMLAALADVLPRDAPLTQRAVHAQHRYPTAA